MNALHGFAVILLAATMLFGCSGCSGTARTDSEPTDATDTTAVTPPAPTPAPSAPVAYGAVPTQGQIDWQRRELLMFYHYGQATFSGWDGENSNCNGSAWSESLLLSNYEQKAFAPGAAVAV